jgi:sulfur carrier protein ThiS
MNIKIKILPRNIVQNIEIKPGTTISELLQKIHLRPGPFVVLKNNVRMPLEFVLNNNDDLSILQVVSGG